MGLTSTLALSVINLSLRQDETLRSYLSRHDQKILAVSWKDWLGQYKVVDGQLTYYPQGKSPNLKICVPDDIITQLSLGKKSFSKQIVIEGETHFAQDIDFIAKNLSLPVEELLTTKIGPTATQIIMKILSSISDECASFAQNTVETIVHYGTNQGELFVSEEEWRNTMDKAQQLSSRISNIEKRIDNLFDKMKQHLS
ncbi:putative coiled coil protein [Candidatus Ichthyocystis hellenicum]|uniref:Putative coiled coil protein n=1 Tax=Candidatus Ichthyocystis hellenicum TaxID=1561003 RepID=A0A0S4M140_9BURK|nr:hypothetical protein [Candidatus Ichthyocystis hellenicum]CUT17003.1 putative coiled coil protein [Candidatus Ichthyocystis hellenicum]